MELSKKDKKTARKIIEIGLEKEFAKGLFDADAILDEWKTKSSGNREAYHALYKHISRFDRHIANRYDGMTGSQYMFIIAAQLMDALISEEHLNEFAPEVKNAVIRIAGIQSGK